MAVVLTTGENSLDNAKALIGKIKAL